MEVASLRVAVHAEHEDQQRLLEGILNFIGLKPAEPAEADVDLIGGEVDGPLSRPTIVVGQAPESDPQLLAAMPEARYHSLLDALGRVEAARGPTGRCPDAFGEAVQLAGGSANAFALQEAVSVAAQTDLPALISGEKGTCKEDIARLVHSRSDRAGAPFVPLDCSAVPDALIDSELFGHERGAFVGALTSKTGRLALAGSGIVFLDRVEALPYQTQVKLLRTLQDGGFTPAGGDGWVPCHARILCASAEDLEQLAHRGDFREDLYYKLSSALIDVPALRDCREDLERIVEAIAEDIERRQNITLRLSMDVIDRLRAYPWPGNTRELRNLMQRLSIQHGKDVVTTKELPAKFAPTQNTDVEQTQEANAADAMPGSVRLPVNGLDLKDYLARLERSLIEQALDDTGAVVARAADRLHIRRTTLVEKMRKYGITRD